jgi:HSP20 family protein
MSLIRYQSQFPTLTPLDRLTTLRDEMNRLFDLSQWGGAEDRWFSGWSPAVDVHQDKDNVYVKVELPGMKKEDIDISLRDNVLSISGERKNEWQTKEGETFRSERFFGRFNRSVTLPIQVEADRVKAQYKEGILTVSLAKAETAKPKQIEVQAS